MKHIRKENLYVHTAALSNTDYAEEAEPFDVIILGAGAAGLMCALAAARRQRRVALVDHNAQPGRKIAVSGGGKANFTNLRMGSAYYVGEDPSFVEPALEAFPPQAMTAYMDSHHLPWEEREHGQLFGLHSADTLVDALRADCQRLGCFFLGGHNILEAHYAQKMFHVRCAPCTSAAPQDECSTKGLLLRGTSLVLALGSPAWPQVGGSDVGLRLARLFGHAALPFRPALVPLDMPAQWPLRHLTGISLKVNISTGPYAHEDQLLITHRGISGPAVLQLSCHWTNGQPLCINFLPQLDFGNLLDSADCGKLLTRTLLGRHMPQRLAQALLPPDLADRKVAELSRAARTTLAHCVHKHTVQPTGNGGMRRAEAALGGLRTCHVNAWSMESQKQPGLYLVGELLDITGHLGGYNLHWAWASGHMAGCCA